MPILVMCSNPECGAIFDVPDDAAGTKVDCPTCGTVETVPVPANRPVKEDEAIAQEPSSDDRAVDRPAAAGEGGESRELDLQPVDDESSSRPQGPPGEVMRGTFRDAQSVSEQGALDLQPVEPSPYDNGQSSEPSAATAETGEKKKEPTYQRDEEIDEFWEELSPFEDIALIGTSPTMESGVEGTLESKWVVATILFIGLLGMAAGILVGAISFPETPILAAFIGGCLGWVAFFILSFLLVLANEREEFSKRLCPVCHHTFPSGIELCQFCGAPLLSPNYNPLTAEFHKAGSYALSNKLAIYTLAMLVVAGNVLFEGVGHILGAFPNLPKWGVRGLIGLCAVVGFLIFSAWAEFLLGTLKKTLESSDKVLGTPRFGHPESIVTGIKVLGLLMVYAVPLFAIPLLPLGLLFLAAGAEGAFNPLKISRIMWRHTKDSLILWLWILLCAAVVVFGVVVAMVLYRLSEMIPSPEESSTVVMSMIFSAVEKGIIGAIGCMCALAVFRCIGLFGRKNADKLFVSHQWRRPARMSGGRG